MGRNRTRKRRLQQVIKGGMVRLASRRKKAPPVTNDTNGTNGSSLKMEMVRVPAQMDDSARDGSWLRLGPIMTTIVVMSLAWIAVVSWLSSQMPER